MKKLFIISLVFLIGFTFSCKKKDDGTTTTDNNSGGTLDLPDGYATSSKTNIFDLTYGGSGNNDDELTSGMVSDNSGNSYISMNVTDATANKSIVVVRVNSDGSLGWGKKYDDGSKDWSNDSGENAETGGTAGSISIDSDGNIYAIATSDSKGYCILVLKINPSDGSIIWQKRWKPEWPTGYPTGSQDAEGYAIDASGDYVYFTGTVGSNETVVGALDKSNGAIVFQYALNVSSSKSRGYAIKEDGSGNLFVGGVDGSYAYFAKINNANTASPALAWIKHAGLSYGARINGIDIDNSGVYFSCDIRGVDTYFQVMKIDFSGNFLWGKKFPGINDRNNTHVVKISGDYLFAGGRIGESGMDLMGESLLLKLSKDNGAQVWAGMYYTGKMSDESAEHRIKGISVVGSNIYVAGQVYGGNDNTEKFSGEWVENASLKVSDASASFSDISTSTFTEFQTGAVEDGTINVSDYSTGILQKSADKKTDNPPDCDTFIMKLAL